MLREEGLKRTKKHDGDTINRRIMSSRTEAGGKTTMLKQLVAIVRGGQKSYKTVPGKRRITGVQCSC